MERNRWLALAAIVATLALFAFVAANPPVPGSYVPCGFYQITGLHCPGCGGTRALHSVLNGNLATALRMNALIYVALPLALVYLSIAGHYVAMGKWSAPRVPGTRVAVAALILVLVFGILRNLPWFSFLAPPN